MSLAITLLAVLLADTGLLIMNAVAIHFIRSERILKWCDTLFRVGLATAAVTLGSLVVILFLNSDEGVAKAIFLMMLIVTPYPLYLAIKGFPEVNNKEGQLA